MSQIPDTHKDLLNGPVVVAFTTIMPDGMPQTTPVWCGWDGEHIVVNTARGRRKEKNVLANPKVNVLAIDPQNPYRWLEVRGTVAELTEDGAIDHINTLAKLYVGKDTYFGGVAPAEAAETQTRVIIKIKPERVVASG